MIEDEKMQVAVFRFGVISDFVTGAQMSRAEKRRLMRDKCARKWQIPFSEKTSLSIGTINRWCRLYKDSNGDLKSLHPQDRCDQGKSRAMDEDTCLSLIELKLETPALTVPQLIEQMNRQNRVNPGIVLNNSTVYRFLHQQNLIHLQIKRPVDRRKFEAELPNDLWQSDVMHGPKVDVNGKMRKSYLIAVIDDHSRLITHGQFYLSEALRSYLQAFENALAKRGLPRKLYVDNGAAFRSRHLEYVCASLAIALIHSKPYKPQGRGKIERFFRTVRGQFLTGFRGQTLYELNEAFDGWLSNIYHQRKHSSTKQSPIERFAANLQCLRAAPDNLYDYFRKVARRKVNKDRTITLNGRLFEGPVALIGKRVELLYHDSDPQQVEVKYQNKSFGMLVAVNLNVNCRIKRDKNNNPQIHSNAQLTEYGGGKLWASKRRDDDQQ
ncbi:MAG: DDE-type integrase/transposase/recombinase [Deltaproteobacteria bacterium]|nr:DDE-type integrase/transposase/recombinase [Deltaproteobacteria bacterium]MBW2583019.1 DDE-type integrase/transposase/recombinase [Deltaproteobacteria bacterium]